MGVDVDGVQISILMWAYTSKEEFMDRMCGYFWCWKRNKRPREKQDVFSVHIKLTIQIGLCIKTKQIELLSKHLSIILDLWRKNLINGVIKIRKECCRPARVLNYSPWEKHDSDRNGLHGRYWFFKLTTCLYFISMQALAWVHVSLIHCPVFYLATASPLLHLFLEKDEITG